jgi:hypothetical protein
VGCEPSASSKGYSVTYTKRKDVGAEVTLPAWREQHLLAQRK